MKRGTRNLAKVDMLMEVLDLERWGAVGVLESLWHWSRENTPRGDVGRFPDSVIAKGIGWTRSDPSILIEALVGCGWIDRHDDHRLLVHDWPEHADDSVHAMLARAREFFADGSVPRLLKLDRNERPDIEKFYRDSAARAATGGRRRRPAGAAGARPTAPGGGLPCPAIPCPAIPSQEERPSDVSATAVAGAQDPLPGDGPDRAAVRARQIEIDRSFAIFWAAYPKKVDKQDVQAAWRRLAPSADLAAEIMAGLERWKTCDRWRHGGTEFVIDPIRFLKRRRWESDPPTTAEHPGPVAPPRTAAETTMANLRAVAAEKGIAR